MPVVITWPARGRRKGVQLSSWALAAGVCGVILAGCERDWRLPSTASTHGASRTANALTGTANHRDTSSRANARSVPSTTNAYAASSGTNALSSTENASIATRLRPRTPVPLPDQALLSPQPEPDCKYNGNDPKLDELIKLDYERQCYRHAEMIVRGRLELLQGSVDKTIKAVKPKPNGS